MALSSSELGIILFSCFLTKVIKGITSTKDVSSNPFTKQLNPLNPKPWTLSPKEAPNPLGIPASRHSRVCTAHCAAAQPHGTERTGNVGNAGYSTVEGSTGSMGVCAPLWRGTKSWTSFFLVYELCRHHHQHHHHHRRDSGCWRSYHAASCKVGTTARYFSLG